MPVGATTLKNVLISGGTGFVGAATARALAAKHPTCAITVVDLNSPGSVHVVPHGVSFIQADITHPEETEEVVNRVKPDVIIHTAGIVPVLGERFGRKLEGFVWKINVEGTKSMLEAAKQAGVKAFIYTSSCCAVMDDMDVSYPYITEDWPTSPSSTIYGESKVVLSKAGSMPTRRVLTHRI